MSLSPVVGGLVAGGAKIIADQYGSAQQREFNAEQASIDRDWQERMSNTAYQRAADDMQAAGLNRILALGSPSSTPSGAQASMSLPSYGSSVDSAISASSAQQSISESKSRETNVKQQTKNLATTLKKIEQEVIIAQGDAATSMIKKSIYRAAAPLVDVGSKKIMDYINSLSAQTASEIKSKKSFFDFGKKAQDIIINIQNFSDRLENKVRNSARESKNFTGNWE